MPLDAAAARFYCRDAMINGQTRMTAVDKALFPKLSVGKLFLVLLPLLGFIMLLLLLLLLFLHVSIFSPAQWLLKCFRSVSLEVIAPSACTEVSSPLI
jgi:hypothetical protein